MRLLLGACFFEDGWPTFTEYETYCVYTAPLSFFIWNTLLHCILFVHFALSYFYSQTSCAYLPRVYSVTSIPILLFYLGHPYHATSCSHRQLTRGRGGQLCLGWGGGGGCVGAALTSISMYFANAAHCIVHSIRRSCFSVLRV